MDSSKETSSRLSTPEMAFGGWEDYEEIPELLGCFQATLSKSWMNHSNRLRTVAMPHPSPSLRSNGTVLLRTLFFESLSKRMKMPNAPVWII